MKKKVTLDCLGLYCPLPLIKATAKLKELEPGEILEIVSEDETVKRDFPHWCRKTGHIFLGIEEGEGIYRVYIRKRG